MCQTHVTGEVIQPVGARPKAGCIAYARIPDRKRTKLDDKVECVRFLSYSKGGKGHHLLEEVGN